MDDVTTVAEERLRLAREALLADGYFTPDQVGDDIAPRITERLAAARGESAARGPGDDYGIWVTTEPHSVPWWRRKRPVPMPARFEALAVYNAERARGIAHTAEWDARMAALQADFSEWAKP
jgi:hypothetical protein